MKRFTLALFVLVLLVASFAFPVFAQDDDMMGAHVCDSTTILLLYIAEYDFGFESMSDMTHFEKGQFASLFEEMMMMDEEMGDDEMMDEEMDDEEMMDEEMADDMMVTLELPVIDGEDEACTALRVELDTFFHDYLFGMMDDMDSDS